jgi:DNA polymerase alpha-associated DNA helicase A
MKGEWQFIQLRVHNVFIDTSLTEPSIRMTHALNDLKKDSSNTALQRVLFGFQQPEIEEVQDVKFFDDTLNESQREAVRFALASKDIALVHGPPGLY